MPDPLKKTPLTELHREIGARLVAFSGYEMPVQFTEGIIREHLHTRDAAGLFDVSHMGQIMVTGDRAAEELETLMPANLLDLGVGQSTYSLLTTLNGGVYDDLIVTRDSETSFYLVVNGACKAKDLERIAAGCPTSSVEMLQERALLALQGPEARPVIGALAPEASSLTFMSGCHVSILEAQCYVTCSGYTGEDGFELSVPAGRVETIARALLGDPRVKPIGLGARDSLRLEAGLCLYGHELSESITPIEAGLRWSISSARRSTGARPLGFPGASIILDQLALGSPRTRVGLKVTGKRPVREGQEIQNGAGETVGIVTSGGFGPSVDGPIAMGLIATASAVVGTVVFIDVRGKLLEAEIVPTPFVKQRYFRG
jgi:aminomethyltransferase